MNLSALEIWPCRREVRANGFTLIEVLVALVIITVAMTSVYRLQGDTLRMSTAKRFYSLAPKLAKGKLAEIESQGFKNATDGSGDFGQDFPGYTWTVRLEDVHSDLMTKMAQKSQTRQHLTRIEVTVALDEKTKYELRTYRFHVD
ncbi:MAG: prepilin-type N-terminal cleavage/methylation domain-containing protein [Desulfobacteraceae bacterium]|nr:prepilin-type N-terminal cleavage/methylation domain-containing protein [Desulfobacteraceae bacterium]